MKFLKISSQLKSIFFPMLVFGIAFAGYLITPRSSQVYSDSRWSIHLALSIIREGNLNLDEYNRLITPDDYAIQTLQGHKYSFYPIGAPLLALPFVFVYNLINPNTFALIGRIHPVAQEIIASFITALTAVFMYLIARRSLTVKQSLLVAFIFVFCTSAWSTASRALWQHGPTMLCLSLALYLVLLSRDRPHLIQFVSLPLAYSYVIRPLNAVSIIFFSGFVLLYYRKYFIKFVLWSIVIALPFFVINFATFHAFLQPQIYAQTPGVFSIPSIERLLGPFISPSRGLFIFSPIFLFSFFGLYLKLKDFRKNYPQNMLDIALAAIFVVHCLLVSSWWMWWGGYSIGPRMLLDMVPYLIFFLLPVIPLISNATKFVTPLRIAFAGCLIFSFLIQFQATRSDAMWGWNNVPTAVDLDQARLWDWGDPQFLRGFSLFYNIFPPALRTDPAEINLYCTVGDDETKCKTSMELSVRPWQAINWEAKPPRGVRVVPARGQDFFKRPRLAIHLTELNTTPGTYNLGELKIAAIQKEGAQLSRTITVPIFLHLEPAGQP
jgi:hypothetical protein